MASEPDIPETGAIFTFGRSRFARNEPSRFWVRNDRILQLACGDEHTALITESGRIFTFGLNEWGQLGLGDTLPRDKPSCIKDLKKENVTLVACGRSHTIVTTDSGNLYTFGSNGEGQLGVKDIADHKTPIRLDSFPANTKYKMVGAGVDHSVCLTENGRVYVWGGNSEGQLGTGSNDDNPVPTLLAMDEPIIAIAVGYYHTALLTETGSVFVFGEVDSGKLGLGNGIKSCRQPRKLSLGCHRIQGVSCGGSHTILLTDQKEVYTCGNGENGQLGHGTSKQQISVPEKLNLPFKVTAICCGENHTALLSEDGYLYTCGDGRHGKLGQAKSNYSNQFEPSQLHTFDPFIVDKVACGGCHMMVLAHHRSLSNGDTPESMTKLSFEGNQTLLDNSLELSGSLSARDRRRQTTDFSFSSLNRTLPSLSGKTLPPLHNSNHLQNSISPAVEVRHLPKLKNTLSLEGVSKTNIAEDESEKSKSMTCFNEDKQKSSSSENNIKQPIKSVSEIPKPKAAPRTSKPVAATNSSAMNGSSSNNLLEEHHLPLVDIAKEKGEEKEKIVNDDVQSIEDVANKKNSSKINGFSTNLINGNAIVSMEINNREDESKISSVQDKEKKKKTKVKIKKKERAKESKESSMGKGDKTDSDESETEELELKEGREVEELKPKKTPRKMERKKSKKQKDNEKKHKEKSEEEDDEEEEEEKEEEYIKEEKKSQNLPSKKNSKSKSEKLKEKEEEEKEDEKESERDIKKQQDEKKKKNKKGGGDADDNDDEEKKADPINKLVFAEDLKPKSENEENATNKKSNTCCIL